jgi:tripartite-type tricarboxylate transporter receptor subunit TctC
MPDELSRPQAMRAPSTIAVAALLALAVAAVPARADPVGDFYHGRTISVLIGAAAGGGTDLAGRLMARYLGKYLPGNPSLVPQNMQGAGGITETNYIANSAPRDGTVIGILVRGVIQAPMLHDPTARYDPLKLTWIGTISSSNQDAYLLVVRGDRGVRTIADMRRAGPPVVLGSSGGNSTDLVFAALSPALFGFNSKLIMGYPGSTGVTLALRRKEIDGLYSTLQSLLVTGMLDTGELVPVMQAARTTRHPKFSDVPLARELVTRPEDKALLAFIESLFRVALPFAGPPGVPLDRAEALRRGFMQAAADPALIADAAKLGIDVSPLDGTAVADTVATMKNTPDSVIEHYRKIVFPEMKAP